ncbi:MAG: DUF748 domain-containing protein [Deferrisomatales bacterium]
MTRPVKILSWLTGAVALLGLLVVLGARLYLTQDRILGWVVPPLEERLNRRVRVAGAGGGLTGLRLEGFEVRAEGAGEPLLAAALLRVRWDPWALLTGKVQVDEVRLVGPQIRVVRRADGTLDVDDLLRPGPQAAPPAPGAPAEPPGTGAVALAVALFSLEDGRVVFEDHTHRPARVYALDAIDSRVTDFALDRPFRYALSARLPLAAASRFSAEGTLDPATRAVSAAVRVADFDLPAVNDLLPPGTAFAAGMFGLDLEVALAGGSRATVQGTLGAQGVTLRSGSRLGQTADLTLEVAAGADLDAGTARVERLELSAAGQKLRAEARVTGLKGRPRVEFQLASDELRVDPLAALLPAGDGAAAPADAPPAAAPGGPPEPPPLDFFGDLRVGRLLAGGAVVEDLAARVELDRGILRVEPLAARLYGGTLRARTRAELGAGGVPFDAGLELAGTQLDQLLAAASPALQDTMTGALALSLQARGRGGDLRELRSQARAEAKDGVILNHPLAQQLARLFQVAELETLNFYRLTADVTTAGGVGTVESLVLHGPNLRATAAGTVGLLDRALDLRVAVAVPRELAARLIPERRTLDALTDAEGWSRLPLRLTGTVAAPSYGLDTEGVRGAAAKALGGKAQKALEEKVLKKLPLGERQKGALQEGLKKLFGQ